MDFWDTAGEEKFKDTLSNAYFRRARAAIFVFSLDEAHSLSFLDKWVEDALVYSPQDVMLFLVGSMADKIDRNSDSYKEIRQQAEFLQERYNMAGLFETSSRSGYGVKEMLESIARTLGQPALVDRQSPIDDMDVDGSSCSCWTKREFSFKKKKKKKKKQLQTEISNFYRGLICLPASPQLKTPFYYRTGIGCFHLARMLWQTRQSSRKKRTSFMRLWFKVEKFEIKSQKRQKFLDILICWITALCYQFDIFVVDSLVGNFLKFSRRGSVPMDRPQPQNKTGPLLIWVFGHFWLFCITEENIWCENCIKIQRKSWSNVPPKLLACSMHNYSFFTKLYTNRPSPKVRSRDWSQIPAWKISMTLSTLVHRVHGYKSLLQSFKLLPRDC